jgi:hypothetical protein
MHPGIVIFMGLVAFGLIMIGADGACLRDDDYRALRRYAISAWRRGRARRAVFPGHPDRPELESPVPDEPVAVLDGGGLCRYFACDWHHVPGPWERTCAA